MTDLSGKGIVVTGASRGLGRAIAEACHAAGARVGVGYTQAAHEARAVANACGGVAIPFDVAVPEQVEAAVRDFVDALGVVDGWVNNAAVNFPGLLVTKEPERIRRQLEVNLLGPMWCSRAIAPHMMRRRGGVVLNISSVAATRPFRGQSAYAASKGGLEAFTRAFAVEYAKKGVRALCLRPGPIDTSMLAGTRVLDDEALRARVPLGRPASPAEVAAFAAFLLSDAAWFATGSCISADGGYEIG